MVQTHAPPAFPRFTRFGRNVLDTWNEADQSNDCCLEAAIMLGVSLVAHEMVPLRDRCSFGRFTWLISQALTVTYVVGEHRLYLERNCRLPESGPQETAESRGAC